MLPFVFFCQLPPTKVWLSMVVCVPCDWHGNQSGGVPHVTPRKSSGQIPSSFLVSMQRKSRRKRLGGLTALINRGQHCSNMDTDVIITQLSDSCLSGLLSPFRTRHRHSFYQNGLSRRNQKTVNGISMQRLQPGAKIRTVSTIFSEDWAPTWKRLESTHRPRAAAPPVIKWLWAR